MKTGILAFIAVIISATAGQNVGSIEDCVQNLQNAYEYQLSDLQVQCQGAVNRILPDDLIGSKHQRFILQLSPLQTILIAHNIDIADRVEGLQLNTTVEFYGEYEWNPEGGVVHWTHHDPDGLHVDGWLKYAGKIYQ